MNSFTSVTRGCRLSAAVVAGVVVAFSSTLAQAQPISGSISFTGGADVNGSLSTATAYTGFFDAGSITMPVVLGSSQTGSYASVPTGTQVTFYPFTFLPFTSPQTLWSFTTGGETYSFTATSLSDIVHPGYLNLTGNGFASITGVTSYTETAATWSYTDTGSGAGPAFNFGATITATPEPSAASLMTVLAVAGGAFRIAARRKSCPPTGVS